MYEHIITLPLIYKVKFKELSKLGEIDNLYISVTDRKKR